MKKYYLEEYIVAATMLVMLVVLFANIVGRVVFGASISFSQELVVYLFAVSSIIGASAACARGANMGLSLITDNVPPAAQIVFAVIGCVASIALFVLLFKQGLDTALMMFRLNQRTPILRWPSGLFELSYPVGSVLYIFRVIQATMRKIKEITKGGTGA